MSKNAARKQEDKQKKTSKIRKLRNYSMDLEDLIANLSQYEDDKDLLRILISYLIAENERRYSLDQENTDSREDLERSKALLDAIQSEEQESDDSADESEKKELATPSNDREVTTLRRYMAKTIRILKHLYKTQFITETVYLGHSSRLKLNTLNAEVNAYLRQGDASKEKQDNMAAGAYYKHAKELLVTSDISFEGKTSEIKRISKLVSNIYATEVKYPNEFDYNE